MVESASTSTSRRRRPGRHTAGQWAILVVNLGIVVACLLAAGALVYGKRQLDNTLAAPAIDVVTTTRPNVTITTPGTDAPGSSTSTPDTFPPADPGAKNFLITGSDANACVDPGSPWAGAADPSRDSIGNRSDSIMVLRLDTTSRRAAVLSFPRDLWVKIPDRAKNRINTAYEPGDSRLLAQTIYDNFGVVIDHYLQVDFCTFKLIVDAVGGVAVPFANRIIDKTVNLDVPAGCHTFNGDEALAYVRSRHLKWVDAEGTVRSDGASDLGRISRQQDFLRRTLQTALDRGLFDTSVARALIESLQKYVVRDANLLSLDSILRFAGVLRNIEPSSINTYQVDGTPTSIGGRSVLVPALDTPNMSAILDIFRGVTSLVPPPPSSTPVSADTTLAPGATTTIVGPEENVKGEIVPDENVTC